MVQLLTEAAGDLAPEFPRADIEKLKHDIGQPEQFQSQFRLSGAPGEDAAANSRVSRGTRHDYKTKPKGSPRHQPGVGQPQAQARHVPVQSRFSGCVMSDLDGRLEITWPNTVTLAQLADDMEFEALVPVARWRGFGGATDPQGPGFETFTWAAGIAGATQHAGVISTSHVALNHPIIAAKQSTVIDHISNGRYTLNVVNGWNFPEMEMFGVSMLEHDDRYACAEEWLTIVKRLWSEDERFDFDGKFYRIKGGYLQPKPIQAPYPAIMNAGSSERGRHFACKHCDLVFTNIRTTTSRPIRPTSRPTMRLHARNLRPRGSKSGPTPQSSRPRPRKRRATSTIITCTKKAIGSRPATSSTPWRPKSTNATIPRSGATPWPR